MNTKLHGKVFLANETIKSGLFATIFIFLSNLGGIRAIFEEQLKIYLFPFAVVTEIITTILALTGLISAKNRNLGKTFDLFHSLSVTSLVLTAVVGGLWFGIAPIVVSSLFVAAIGMGALYSLGQFAYHGYRWLRTPSTLEDKTSKAMYGNQAIKYAITSLLGLAVVAGIITTLMLPAAAPIVITIGGMTAANALGIGLYKLYKFQKPVIAENHSLENIEQSTEGPDINFSSESEQALVTRTKSFDYYNIQPHFAPRRMSSRLSLQERIWTKINSLEHQIEESRETYSGRLQRTKRENKIACLKLANEVMQDLLVKNNFSNHENIRSLENYNKPNTFQSFFKHKGDVELIYDDVLSFVEFSSQRTHSSP